MYITEEEKNHIRACIIEVGLTYDQLCKKAGVNSKTFYNKLYGKSDFTRSEMESLSKVIGMSPAYIFFEK